MLLSQSFTYMSGENTTMSAQAAKNKRKNIKAAAVRKNKGVVTVHVVSKIVYNHKLENSIQNLIIYSTCFLKSFTPNKLFNGNPS